MGLRINDVVPDFTARTNQGEDPLPRLDRRQLGDPVLASKGLHPRVHDGVRRRGAAERRVEEAGTPR